MNQDPSIVVLEDDPNDHLLLKETLASWRIRNPIVWFERGESARAHFAAPYIGHLPAVFVIDLFLAVPDGGLDFLRWLRTQPGDLGQTPAIILTGSADQASRATSYELGALFYLEKPATESGLEFAMHSLGVSVVTSLTSGHVEFRVIGR